MKKKLVPVLFLLALGLCGCSVFNGQYHRVTPHKIQSTATVTEAYSAQNYQDLHSILGVLIESGSKSGVIFAEEYDADQLERDLAKSKRDLSQNDPIGSFAVEDISYQIGTNNGKTAVAVDVKYSLNPAEIHNLIRVEDLEEASAVILDALGNGNPRTVIYIHSYQDTDFTQVVRDLAQKNPQIVMEIPQVLENVYGNGSSRVVELNFTFETGRDSLRQMQTQVRPIFDAAVLYVSGEGSDNQKLSQLYALLMERFEYSFETSITPSYSLLRHGVGDSRAFATVYAAMCQKAGLDCRIVTGTRMGESWIWNIVRDGDDFYHVDLLRCNEEGQFAEKTTTEMTGYVWDYTAYPQCGPVEIRPKAPEIPME